MNELRPDDNNADRWEAHYVANDAPWDKQAPSPALAEILKESRFAGPVLVPGCGRGHDVAAIAQAGHEVVGIDLAATGVADAQKQYPDLAAQFVVADLFTYVGRFQAVFEHTCYCAMHPAHRRAYVEAMHRLLEPDGRYFGVLYITDEPEEIPGPPFRIPRSQILDGFTSHFEVVWSREPRETFSSRRGSELLVELRPK